MVKLFMSMEECMGFSLLFHKIKRKILKTRLYPIRVFVFHQVSETFEPETMVKNDWTELGNFKAAILKLKMEYEFISLKEAEHKIATDHFRRKDYAVLTSDDGWQSLLCIVPWLVEQKIPVTLFVNLAYFDGKTYRTYSTERYLSQEELKSLVISSNGLVTIGLHGWEHTDATQSTEMDFRNDVAKAFEVLSQFPNFVPYFAFTWGRYNDMTLKICREFRLTPIFTSGNKNYNDPLKIDRDCIDGITFGDNRFATNYAACL